MRGVTLYVLAKFPIIHLKHFTNRLLVCAAPRYGEEIHPKFVSPFRSTDGGGAFDGGADEPLER